MSSPDFLTCPAAPELPGGGAGTPLLPAPKRSRKGVWCFLFALFLFFLPLFIGAGMMGIGLLQVGTVWPKFRQAVAEQNIDAAARAVQTLQTEARVMRLGAQATLYWHFIPWIGSELAALEESLSAGQSLLRGTGALVQVLQTLQGDFASFGARLIPVPSATPERTFRDLGVEEKRIILAHAARQLSLVRSVREELSLALEAWRRAPQSGLSRLLEASVASKVDSLLRAKTELDQLIPLAEVLIPLMGFPKERRYLVVLQNADELRPTGGFLGTVGILEVDAATIKTFFFQDVYAIDGPVGGTWKDVPPEPLARELGVRAWFLRDSNWSPDFPTTAERLMDVYTREVMAESDPFVPLPAPFDGVIALQPKFFERLLALTGPVAVDDEIFTSENFFTQLQYDVEIGFRADHIPLPQRKDIVAKLGDGLVAALEQLPASRWGELLVAVTDSLAQKDILIYMRDPSLLRVLDHEGWTGRAKSSDGDFLWVVDTNVAALKTDGVMQKSISYTLDAAAPDGPMASVTLQYTNTNRVIDWRRTRYRDYVRVYAPEGSELVSAEGVMAKDFLQSQGLFLPGKADVMRDLGKTVFGGFWSVEPGETRTLRFTYRLPAALQDQLRRGTYRLFVQKQPGNRSQLTLDLSFGKKVLQADPPEAFKDFGDHRYQIRLPLEQDRFFQVSF